MRKISSSTVSIAMASIVALTALPTATAQLSSGSSLSSAFGPTSGITEPEIDMTEYQEEAESRPEKVKQLETTVVEYVDSPEHTRTSELDLQAYISVRNHTDGGVVIWGDDNTTGYGEGDNNRSTNFYIQRVPLSELDQLLDAETPFIADYAHVGDEYGLYADSDGEYAYLGLYTVTYRNQGSF